MLAVGFRIVTVRASQFKVRSMMFTIHDNIFTQEKIDGHAFFVYDLEEDAVFALAENRNTARRSQ